MVGALTVYVVLVLPAILGALKVGQEVLDLIERIEARRRQRAP